MLHDYIAAAFPIWGESFSRFVPLSGFLLYLLLAVFVRSWLQARRYGTSSVALLRPKGATQVFQAIGITIVHLVLLGETIAAAWFPRLLDSVSAHISHDAAQALLPIGAVLFFVATWTTFVAQLNLGASWNIGIDADVRPGLVTDGLYRFCRNPIYLFGFVAAIGFMLMLPNWLTVALLASMIIGVRHGVTLEEQYLRSTYGAEYREYAHRVGRFVPWLGRL